MANDFTLDDFFANRYPDQVTDPMDETDNTDAAPVDDNGDPVDTTDDNGDGVPDIPVASTPAAAVPQAAAKPAAPAAPAGSLQASSTPKGDALYAASREKIAQLRQSIAGAPAAIAAQDKLDEKSWASRLGLDHKSWAGESVNMAATLADGAAKLGTMVIGAVPTINAAIQNQGVPDQVKLAWARVKNGAEQPGDAELLDLPFGDTDPNRPLTKYQAIDRATAIKTGTMQTNRDRMEKLDNALKFGEDVRDQTDISSIVHHAGQRKIAADAAEGFQEGIAKIQSGWGKGIAGAPQIADGIAKLINNVGETAWKNPTAAAELVVSNMPQLAAAAAGSVPMAATNIAYAMEEYSKGIEEYQKMHNGQLPTQAELGVMAAKAGSLAVAEYFGDKAMLGAKVIPGSSAVGHAIEKTAIGRGAAAVGEGAIGEFGTEYYQTHMERNIEGKPSSAQEDYVGGTLGAIAGGSLAGGVHMLTPGPVKEAAPAQDTPPAPAKAVQQAQEAAKQTGDVSALTDPENVAYAPDRAIQALMVHTKRADAAPEDGENNLMQAYEVASQFNQAYDAKTKAFEAIEDKTSPEAKTMAKELNAMKRQVVRTDALLADFEKDFFASMDVAQETAKLDTPPEEAAATVDGGEAAVAPAAAKAANNLVNLSMVAPERVDEDTVAKLIDHPATTAEQKDYLRKFNETRVAENETRSQGDVSTEIVDGSAKNMGIKQYRAQVTEALSSGSKAKAESRLQLLTQFLDSHTEKAKLAAEEFAKFQDTGKPVQIQRNKDTKSWEVVTDPEQFLKGDARKVNGAVNIDQRSSKLVPAIQQEADTIAAAHAELRSAIALRFNKGAQNVSNAPSQQASPVGSQPSAPAAPVQAVPATAAPVAAVPAQPPIVSPTKASTAVQPASATDDPLYAQAHAIAQTMQGVPVDQLAGALKQQLGVGWNRAMRMVEGIESGVAPTTVNSEAASGSSTGVQSQSTERTDQGQLHSNPDSSQNVPEARSESTPSTPDVAEQPTGLSVFQDDSKPTELPEGKLGNGGYRAINRAKAFLKQKFVKVTKDADIARQRPLADIKDFLGKWSKGIIEASSLFPEGLDEHGKQEAALNHFRKMAEKWAPVIQSYFGKDGKATLAAGKSYREMFKHEDVLQDLYDANGKLDENVTTAIAYSMYSWLGDTANGDLFKQTEDIATMHGLSEDAYVSPEGRKALSQVAAMEDTILNDLGQRIIAALGLTVKPSAPVDYLPKLATALGSMALRSMEDQGLVKTTTFTGAQLSSWLEDFTLEDEKSLSYVTLVRGDKASKWELPPVTAMIKSTNQGTGQVVDKLFDSEKPPTEASWSKIPFKQDKAKRTNQNVSKEQRSILQRAQAVPMRIIPQMWDLLTVLGDSVILQSAGHKAEIEGKVHAANKDSVEAQNSNLEQQLDRLKGRINEAVALSPEKLNQPFYLAQEVWRNFRVGIATRDINPQSSKIVRFMMYRPEWKATLKTDNVQQFLVSVAQAVGVKVDTTDNQTMLDTEFKKWQAKNDDLALRLKESIDSKTEMSQQDKDAIAKLTTKGEGMQTLQALVAYGTYLQAAELAKTKGVQEFTVHMLVGVDGKTNGPILSHLALGAAENVKALFYHLQRGGMFSKDQGQKNFNLWYQQRDANGKKNLDLYEDLARVVLNAVDRTTDGYKAIEVFTKSLMNGDQVSSAGRKIVKTPLTAYAFGSAVDRSRIAMREAFISSIHDKIEAVATGEDTTTTRGQLITALNTLLSHEDFVLSDDTTIEQLMGLDFFNPKNKAWLQQLEATFDEVMGSAVEKSMDTYFAVFSERRDLINKSIQAAFGVYAALLKDIEAKEMKRLMDAGEIDSFKTKDGQTVPLHGMTKEQQDAMFQKFEAMLPQAHNAYSQQEGDLAAGLYMGKTSTGRSDKPYGYVKTQMGKEFANGAGQMVTFLRAAIMERRESDPGVAGLPYMMHSTDSAIMHRAISQYIEAMNVHDEIGNGVDKVADTAKAINGATWTTMLHYSPPTEAFNMLARAVTNAMEMHKNGDMSPAVLKEIQQLLLGVIPYDKRKEFYSKPQYVASEALKTMFTQQRKANMVRLEAMGEMTAIDQYTWEGGQYDVTDKDRTEALQLLAEQESQSSLPDDLAVAAVELGKLFVEGIKPKAEPAPKPVTEASLGVTTATAPWATAQGAEQVGTKAAQQVAKDVAAGTPVEEAINAMPAEDKAAMVQATAKAADQVDAERLTPWGVLGTSKHQHDGALVAFFQKNPTTTVRALIQQLNKTVEKGSFEHELLKQLARSANLNAKVHYISANTDPKIAPNGIPKNPAGVPMSRAWYASGNGEIYVTGTDYKHSAVKQEVMLHEMVHAVLTDIINNPTAQTQPHIDELFSLMAQAKTVADSRFDGIFQDDLGIHEFVTYGMTNKAFQQVLLKTTLASQTRGSKLRNAMQSFINTLSSLFFQKNVVADPINNGMAALIANVSALMEQATQNKFTPPLKSDGNLSMQAVQDVLEYSTQDVFAALDDGRLSDEHTNRLTGLLATMVEKLHGKFGSLREAIMNDGFGTPEDAYFAARANGEIPFASKVLAGPFAVSDQVAFVLEQVEVTVKAALDSHDAAAKSAYTELQKLFAEAKGMLKGKISDDQFNFLFEATKDSGDRSDYLARFAAMGLTHPEVNRLLQQATATENKAAPTTIGERVQQWFERMLELLTNKLTGTYAGQQADQKLAKLVQQLVDIETKAKMPLAKNAFVDSISQQAEEVGAKLNEKSKEVINKVANSGFVKGSQNQFIRTAGTLAKVYANDRVEMFLEGVKQVRNREFAGTEGILASLLTEMKGHAVAFQKLIRAAKMREGERKTIIDQGAAAVLAAFKDGDKMTDAEKAALSQVFMRAGAHNLLDGYSLKQIEQLLSKPDEMNREIVRLEKALSSYGSLRGAILEQAQVLGYYKATGRVRGELLHANAHNISRLIGTRYEGKIDHIMAYRSESTIAKLVTLYAMAYASPALKSDARRVLARENARGGENGIEFMLKVHKAMEQESFEKLFKGNPTLMMHGYTPEVYNPNTRIEIAGEEDGVELMKQGFQQGAKVKAAKGDDSGDKHIYIQRDGGLNRRVTGAVSLTDLGAKGTRVSVDNPTAFTKRSVENWDRRTKGGKWDTLPNRAENFAAPIFNENGQITDWRYLMAEDTKDSVLERDNRFEHLLGKMAGSIYDKVETPVQNRKVVEALREDYNQAYADNPEAFIEVGAGVANDKLREIWNLLPQQTKKDVRKVWGRDAMLVRKDSVNIIFGDRKLSAGDVFQKEDRGHLEEAFVRVAQEVFGDKAEHKVRQFERRWQAVVQEIKDIVVIKTGSVMIGNIKSNTMLLAAAGVPFKQGINAQLVALRGATAYRKDSERLAQLQLMKQADYIKGDIKEIDDEIVRLEDSLARNPTKALIDEGLMPSIVEDVTGGEDIYAHRTQFAKDVDEKMDQYLHPTIKAGLRSVYMAHDTKLYQGLHRITQLSDFVARYALYEHLTTRKKNPLSHEDAIQQASEAFINYDIPMHPFLQYMDDMGIMPFMKYFLRIQKVLARIMRESPARSLSLIGLDNLMGIGDSVFDSSILHKVGNNPLTTGAFRYFGVLGELATVKGAMALIK